MAPFLSSCRLCHFHLCCPLDLLSAYSTACQLFISGRTKSPLSHFNFNYCSYSLLISLLGFHDPRWMQQERASSKQQAMETEHLTESLLEQKDCPARRILEHKQGLHDSSILQSVDECIPQLNSQRWINTLHKQC